MKTTCLLSFLFLFPLALRADDISERLTSYMDAVANVDKFHGAVLVAKGDQVLLAKGYGFANAEHEVPNVPETKFRLGSITKQFTATAILILKDQGKLKVDDPIGMHLPDSPQSWEAVTVRHLLTHTSGIPSYTDNPAYRKLMTNPEQVESMIARFRDLPLEFEPGAQFKYNNSGYFLLGAIIEKLSGKTYEQFLKESIFEPLEMRDTGYDRFAVVLPKRASGYERQGDRLVNAPYLDMNQPFAAGSLYSTVGDLLKWDRALSADKLLSKESMAEMFQPFKNNYAYGWAVDERGGRLRIGHGGGINGFMTDFERFPKDGICVAVLCNVVPSNAGKVARDLAAIAYGESVTPPKARIIAKVDPKIFDDYVGTYQFTPTLKITVTREGDHLFGQPAGQSKAELLPESETTFFVKVIDAQFTFVKEDGKVTHAILSQNGRETKGNRVTE